jgi:hypothetical protein
MAAALVRPSAAVAIRAVVESLMVWKLVSGDEERADREHDADDAGEAKGPTLLGGGVGGDGAHVPRQR